MRSREILSSRFLKKSFLCFVLTGSSYSAYADYMIGVVTNNSSKEVRISWAGGSYVIGAKGTSTVNEQRGSGTSFSIQTCGSALPLTQCPQRLLNSWTVKDMKQSCQVTDPNFTTYSNQNYLFGLFTPGNALYATVCAPTQTIQYAEKPRLNITINSEHLGMFPSSSLPAQYNDKTNIGDPILIDATPTDN